MKETPDIKKLLHRFHQGISTPDENLQLLRLLDKENPELNTFSQELWDQNPMNEGKSEREEILRNLHKKLNFSTESEPEKTVQPLRIIHLVARYAAVIIISFGLAWLFFTKYSSGDEQPKPVDYYKVTVAYGSKSTIELPDGSIVTLNSGSTLKYPGSFAVTDRTVILDGEAFFDVKKNTSKPFLVKTKDITVKVLGTKFNVKSYPEENLTETTLVTGKVEITRNSSDKNVKTSESPLVLAPNQKAVFYREKNEIAVNDVGKEEEEHTIKEPLKLKVLVQKEVKTETIISWKNDILVFNSEPFADIIKKLERWYDVEITLKYSKLSPVVFSGKFDQESIGEVLHALSLIEPFKYDVSKNKILIYK